MDKITDIDPSVRSSVIFALKIETERAGPNKLHVGDGLIITPHVVVRQVTIIKPARDGLVVAHASRHVHTSSQIFCDAHEISNAK